MSQGRPSSQDGQVASDAPAAPRRRKQQPQKTIEDFWDKFLAKTPGKVLSILPRNPFASNKAAREPKGAVHGEGALKSYEEARAECELAVLQVSKECRRVNMRYRDPHFDIDLDLKMGYRRCLDCIQGLDPNDSPRPRAVKRVPEIFKKPQFYIDGAVSADVRQGKTGDCYFLAAVGALGNKQGLIDNCCVARDEQVGVYGFVFFRDGEWFHTIIDDKLYLSIPDYDESRQEKDNWGEILNRTDAELEYTEAFQTGSRALYFAQCNDENETWLPLLEKAYAKAHGDYYSIIGGFTGEAIEDLTGGVTTELFATDILDKTRFWEDELKHVGKQFLFGCATGRFDDWQGGDTNPWRQGIVSAHAYTILRASEYKGERLLLVRNPWGQAEWSGRWSDGSEQWTPDSMQALDHKFGDDGMFWISYEDLLRKYQYFDRTRLFDHTWIVSQQWTPVDVRWTADYNDTKFTLTLTEATPVVIVLSQLDDRYWTGLEGQYNFMLHFRVDKQGEEGYEVRSHGNYWMSRSVSTEVDLEPGTYNVFIKVKAERDLAAPRVEDVVRRNCMTNQEKLMQVGLAYDLAHAKGIVMEGEEYKKQQAEAETRQKAKTKKQKFKEAREEKYQKWLYNKRVIERERRQRTRLEAHKTRKEEQAAAANPQISAKDSKELANGEVTQTNGDIKEQSAPGPDQPPSTEQGNDSNTTTGDNSNTDSAAGLLANLSVNDRSGIDANTIPEAATEIKGVNAETEQNGNATPPAIKLIPPISSHSGVPEGDGDGDGDGQANDDAETVLSFASSVDSLLDLSPEGPDFGGDNIEAEESQDSENDEFADDPWNAVCVVGLRVYNKHGDTSVAVVRPKNLEDEDTPLDVDDPSKGISDEVTSPMRETGVPAVKALEDLIDKGATTPLA